MSVKEHTIRIISHRCDTKSRKELIYCICEGISREHCHFDRTGSGMSTTTLLYDDFTVNIVDCDYNLIDDKITENDIIYVDLEKTGSRYYESPERDQKIKWIEQFKNIGATIWEWHGLNSSNGWSRNWINHAADCSYTPKKDWLAFIEKRYQITGIQSTISMFNSAVRKPHSVHSEAPWPVPNMVIQIPQFVKVEDIKYDPENGTITVIFG